MDLAVLLLSWLFKMNLRHLLKGLRKAYMAKYQTLLTSCEVELYQFAGYRKRCHIVSSFLSIELAYYSG